MGTSLPQASIGPSGVSRRQMKFFLSRVAFRPQRRCGCTSLKDEAMNVILIAIGCILMALGLVMAANRSGYLYFVVGPRSVLVVAGVVAMLALWILQAAK
jgi:hypothetical protein